MASYVVVEPLDKKPVEQQEIEMVERKGLGHPDYIIDSACEEASIMLSQYYFQEFGKYFTTTWTRGCWLADAHTTPSATAGWKNP
jgi:S-adenosylmethionine synthetase